MELSLDKTLITRPEEGFNFLGYRVIKERARLTGRMVGKLYIPKEKLQMLRTKIKGKTNRSTTGLTMDNLLKSINPLITGWRNYYRYAVGACKEFANLDRYVWFRVQRWAKKKHPKQTSHRIRHKYACRKSPTRWTWGGEQTLLRLFAQGGTQRYHCRGTKISNGWNDEIDAVHRYQEAARAISGFTITGKEM